MLTDALLTLSAYGFIVRTVVEMIRGFWKPNERVTKGVVAGISAFFVYVLGLDPVGMFHLHAISPQAAHVTGVALLSGAAMGTHDILDYVKNAGSVKS